ncbi:Holliday junction resolvase RuvX [Microcoleus sp. LEGE 07076]|uniref:Holliday junction resolvase RuvX n=1 Tax=Microcoleus sp. LEGE 07076 TaxID=915322 RepID=UPI00188287F3|nr:Holliday junction resolvase RuvX [Microcoleus sp. LEGE 07076]MBE9183264.1 Holliday junction resolvase RuvX [Microcoleus sp. LEGE 07076]
MSNQKLWISALGLDIGSKRVGIAGCDGTGLIATGITTLVRSSFDRDVACLRELVRARGVKILVAGLPYSMNGELGNQARQVQKYAGRIAEALELPLEYVDERLTSVEAEELIKAQGIPLSQNKGSIDRKAAALILQRWLDSRRQNIASVPNLDTPQG